MTDLGVGTARAGRASLVAPVPRQAWMVTGTLFVVLAVLGSRYGYHRDELYFIEAGHHPAWGYPDQPPLVPLIAAGWDVVTGGHLGLFRLLPALVAASVVPMSARISARFGGDARDQFWTALLTAVSTAVVGMGHLFSTATFDLALTVAIVLLALRAIDSGRSRDWLALGLVAGIAMQVQLLPALVLACGVAGIMLAGPRAALRSPWPWVAAGIALVLVAPYLIWQSANGWPQLEVAANIAAGGSTSSVARWAIIPYQLVMVGPPISPVLLVGVRRLARSPELRRFRWLVVGFGLLLVVLVITGGKPYYASALIPPLLAAGVPPVRRWADRHRWTAGILLTGHVVVTAIACLPVAPVGSPAFAFADALNPDTGETVGWNRFTQTGVSLLKTSGATAFLTENYGEAGALDRVRREQGAPWHVYSGHNGYGRWGPPTADVTRLVVIGDFTDTQLGTWFQKCSSGQFFDNGVGLDNDEQGVPMRVCDTPRAPWPELWPSIRHNG